MQPPGPSAQTEAASPTRSQGQSGGPPAQPAPGDATWPGRGARLLSIWFSVSLSRHPCLLWLLPPPSHRRERPAWCPSLWVGPEPR